MKTQKTVILIILFMTSTLISSDFIPISWNQPQIISKIGLSHLSQQIDENKIISPLNECSAKKSDFALSSWSNFKKSVSNFFSVKDQSCFLSYYHKSDQQLNAYYKLSLYSGFDYSTSLENESAIYQYNGVLTVGNIYDKLFFYTKWWSGSFSGDHDYFDPAFDFLDSWTQKSDDGKKTYVDNFSGKLLYKLPVGAISLGRGKYQIGNNIGGSIILDNQTNDYGYFGASLQLGKLEFSLLHATLIPDSMSNNTNNSLKYNDKYLAVHKIDWVPSPNLHFFLGEHVLYGNRDIDPGYLLPVAFYRAIEHNLRDRDNVLIFLGFNYNVHSNVKFYFNFIFDELSKSTIFANWWGNKYAFQVGSSFALRDDEQSCLVIEVTGIRPWLYTHNILENKFSHDGRSLGYPGGSNLINVSTEINLLLNEYCSFLINGSFSKQGNVGNDFSINYDTRPSDNASWLEGDISDIYQITAQTSIHPINHHSLMIGIRLKKVENTELDKQVYLSYQARY